MKRPQQRDHRNLRATAVRDEVARTVGYPFSSFYESAFQDALATTARQTFGVAYEGRFAPPRIRSDIRRHLFGCLQGAYNLGIEFSVSKNCPRRADLTL